MKIPVVLPAVHVRVDEDGGLTIDVDDEPYEPDGSFTRDDLQRVLAAITSERDCAVRVELRESDGTTYTDVSTPPKNPPEEPPEPEPAARNPSVRGTGFQPGEPVAIAYVLLRGTADQDGRANLHLPPSLLARRTAGMVLMGLDSKVATLVETTA